MSRRRRKEIDNMAEASRAVMAQPRTRVLELGSGQQVEIRRLDWISFELLWQELCGLIGGWPADTADIDEALATQLSQAPALILKLAALSTGLTEAELSSCGHDTVLQIAAAALSFNFSEGSGLRDFFGGLAKLWQSAQQEAALQHSETPTE